ncbi:MULTISPECIES: hypothetical protein [unclassified Yoonia]|uniref:hypothetical protein n=1 Tax=unclassified Yoonia TaxID=2629118 RepID=UPI002AFFE8E6|nr:MULTISPECIES: hypothetical protein [unclassified Yoonia]
MRPALILPLILAACTTDPSNPGMPVFTPLTAMTDPGYAQKRGQVEIIVKTNYDAIRRDIDAGGGPVLVAAMDAAGVPMQDRPTRVIQLQSDMGLYDVNPGALVTALMVFGG